MTPKLQISRAVLKVRISADVSAANPYKIILTTLQRLEKVRSQCSGCLFGVMYKGTLLILGFNVENPSTDKLNFKHIQNGFPAELDLCGLVKFGMCTDDQAHLTDILQDIDVTDNPIVLHCELGTTVGLKASLFKHGQLEDIAFEVLEDQRLWNEFIYTRVRCTLEINCAENETAITKALQGLRVYVSLI